MSPVAPPAPGPSRSELAQKPGPWVDLALTLPVFLAYHAGVVFLKIHNASDIVTFALLDVAEGNRPVYLLLTASIGVVFAGMFAWLGRGQAFRTQKFVQVMLEGALYAILMRFLGSYVVAKIFAGNIKDEGVFTGFVMSLGAGFYEELAFRVLLFGLGAKVMVWLFAKQQLNVVQGTTPRLSFKSLLVVALWSLVAAAVFSGVHYTGAMGDKFLLTSFVFRMVLGLTLTGIYLFRGFSTAVWAHALYDIWVLVF
jgi:hypothetical protein